MQPSVTMRLSPKKPLQLPLNVGQSLTSSSYEKCSVPDLGSHLPPQIHSPVIGNSPHKSLLIPAPGSAASPYSYHPLCPANKASSCSAAQTLGKHCWPFKWKKILWWALPTAVLHICLIFLEGSRNRKKTPSETALPPLHSLQWSCKGSIS